MKPTTLIYVVLALASTVSQAAPTANEDPALVARLSLGKTAPKASTPKSGGSSSSGGGLLSGLFGGGKKSSAAPPPPPKTTAAAPPPKTTPAAPPTTSSKSSVSSTSTPPPTTSPSTTLTTSSTTTKSSSTTSTTSANATSTSAAACPLYVAPDAIDISSRELAALEKRAGEEYFFRFEDAGVVNAGNNILQLAARPGGKDFDDQAYKWISTDAAKVTRGSIKGRLPTVYVLPSGTRASLLAAAQKFEDTSEAQKAVDFVTKDNEPGDVGINGVAKSADGTLPLDTFRDKVIRTVAKSTSAKAGGKATFTTITKGKKSATASKADQAALAKFC